MKAIDNLFALLDETVSPTVSRQQFLKTASRGLAVSAVGSALIGCDKKPEAATSSTPATVDTPSGPVPKLPATSPPPTFLPIPQNPLNWNRSKPKPNSRKVQRRPHWRLISGLATRLSGLGT